MARYFFDLHECGTTFPDGEGVDCSDIATARDLAIRSARGLMASEIQGGRLCLSCHIEVRDDQGVAVATVTFKDAVVISGR